jgi:hypothetical protein
MRKGKYIDYTVLLACLSKMPERQQPKNEHQLNSQTENMTFDETQKDKAIKVLELEPV